MLSELYNSLETEDKKHITLINDIKFHTVILNTVPYFKVISTILPLEFEKEEILILKKILYEKEVLPSHDELDKRVYILFDFLSLDIPKYLYYSSSKELYIYLLQQCYNPIREKLIKHLYLNCPKIDVILENVTWEYREYYIFKLEEDKKILIRELMKNGNDPVSINNYAYLLMNGIGGEKDHKLARQLYSKNWEENDFSESCNFYAYMLYFGIGGEKDEEKAKELFLLNWEKHYNYNSLHNYAYMLENNDPEKSRELYLYIWNTFKSDPSLVAYAKMLENGTGGEQNINKARELYKQVWEESKNEHSLLGYAKLHYPKDNKIAKKLLKYGWEKFKNKEFLDFYIKLLRIGTAEENVLADVLEVEL